MIFNYNFYLLIKIFYLKFIIKLIKNKKKLIIFQFYFF